MLSGPAKDSETASATLAGMIARLFILLAVLCTAPAVAQQTVQVPVEQGGRTILLGAQLFKGTVANYLKSNGVKLEKYVRIEVGQ